MTSDLSALPSMREHQWANVRLAYQPVHHVVCRQPAGAEALLRRLEPDGSVLGPQSVLEQADRDGTDFELACYIVSLAAQQAKTWAGDNWLTGYRVGINVSPQVLGRADFATSVLHILEQHECDPRNILLELTEMQYLDHFQCALDQIRQLRAAEILVALDDFGAGYSNIGLLRSLPIDMIKIDPVVFGDEPKAREISVVSHVVGMAQAVGAVVVLMASFFLAAGFVFVSYGE